jgi:hypothetical protein
MLLLVVLSFLATGLVDFISAVIWRPIIIELLVHSDYRPDLGIWNIILARTHLPVTQVDLGLCLLLNLPYVLYASLTQHILTRLVILLGSSCDYVLSDSKVFNSKKATNISCKNSVFSRLRLWFVTNERKVERFSLI